MTPLQKLRSLYGEEAFEYTSDIWGNPGHPTPYLLTPDEAIQLHKQLGWDDSTYTVTPSAKPGQPVLTDHDGTVILRKQG